jgi:hypothetical protein
MNFTRNGIQLLQPNVRTKGAFQLESKAKGKCEGQNTMADHAQGKLTLEMFKTVLMC